jgi:hypothetical protein
LSYRAEMPSAARTETSQFVDYKKARDSST